MKYLFVFTIIAVLAIAIFTFVYKSRVAQLIIEEEYIAQYESYLNKKVLGTDLVTLMNKIVNHNEKLELTKLEDGKYEEITKQAIRLEIVFTDNEETYSLETLYENGTDTFMTYYGPVTFMCEHIEYYENSKNIKMMSFKQMD